MDGVCSVISSMFGADLSYKIYVSSQCMSCEADTTCTKYVKCNDNVEVAKEKRM